MDVIFYMIYFVMFYLRCIYLYIELIELIIEFFLLFFRSGEDLGVVVYFVVDIGL